MTGIWKICKSVTPIPKQTRLPLLWEWKRMPCWAARRSLVTTIKSIPKTNLLLTLLFLKPYGYTDHDTFPVIFFKQIRQTDTYSSCRLRLWLWGELSLHVWKRHESLHQIQLLPHGTATEIQTGSVQSRKLLLQWKTQLFICLMGQKMQRTGIRHVKTASGYVSKNARYRAVRCEWCPLRCLCFKAKGNRVIELNIGEYSYNGLIHNNYWRNVVCPYIREVWLKNLPLTLK